MKTLAAVVIACAVMLAGPSAGATVYEDYPGRKIDRYDVTYDLQADGSALVTIEIDFNFGNNPGRGPIWFFETRVPYDDEHDRQYHISNIRVTSPTNAPATAHLDQGRFRLEVRVGEQNIADVSGVQTYVLTFKQYSVLNTITDSSLPGTDLTEWDEFHWNVMSSGWDLPVRNLTVRVNSPADVIDTRCFFGDRGSRTVCRGSNFSGSTAEFYVAELDFSYGMTVVVAYPKGTFDTQPRLIVASDFRRAFAITSWTVGGAGAVLLAGMIGLARAVRTKGTDQQFKGLVPGLAPAPGAEHHISRRERRTPIAVRFEPPLGLRPGQLGTLIDESADVRDVTATMVDLAVRGYLRVEEAGTTGSLFSKQPDYRLVKLREADDALWPYERTLFFALFRSRDTVTLSGLRTTFAASMSSVQSQLYTNVTTLGWFRGDPNHARGMWAFAGIGILALGVIATIFLANVSSFALVAVPLIVVGIAVIATTALAPARTAEGTRVLMETLGFERYLEVADANQLRYEEGHDIFSQYLPYAISFGVADKWANKFEELAKQGRDLPEPTWYHGATAGAFWANSHNFGSTMNQFSSLANSAISAPTPGSSGGSGFSGGGGGGSGGGGGGGGGSSW